MLPKSRRFLAGCPFQNHTLALIAAFTLSILTPLAADAQPDSFKLKLGPGVLVAQAEGDDAYDPFSDYSEFEATMDEEEDTHFFRNGRLLTMGFSGGMRGWTGNFGKYYGSSPAFGVFLSYFFDLRFALQFGFLASSHSVLMSVPDFKTIRGTVDISDLQFLLKYYLNTQNVTRGLADLNPYIVGGFSQVYRTTTISGNSNFGKDSAFGFNIGGGIELPMLRNKMFFGAQATYQLVTFANEGTIVQDSDARETGQTLSGDSFLVLGILGVNF